MFSNKWIEKESTSVGCIASYESPADGELFDPTDDNTEEEMEKSLVKKEVYVSEDFLDRVIARARGKAASIKKRISKVKQAITIIKAEMGKCKKKHKTKTAIKKCKASWKRELRIVKKIFQTILDVKKGLKK